MKSLPTYDEFLNEARLDDIKQKLHMETDPKKAKKLKMEIGKMFQEKDPKEQEAVGNMQLRSYRAQIGYWDAGTDVYKEDPEVTKQKEIEAKFKQLPRKTSQWTYDQVFSDEWAEAREMWEKKYGRNGKWNMSKYKKWIKDVASGGGAQHAYDMAQNAKNEPGLIDFVRKKVAYGEDPMDRIQWDIEAYA